MVSLPLPVYVSTPNKQRDFPSLPPAARALLDSGAVLGFAVVIKSYINGMGTVAGVRVALPDGDGVGVRWIREPDDIMAQDATTPGLALACLSICQKLWDVTQPDTLFHAWHLHTPDDDSGVAYMGVFVAKDGLVIGSDDPEAEMEDAINEIHGLMEDDDDDDDTDPSDLFDVGQFASIALFTEHENTAHHRLDLLVKARVVFDTWARCTPEWTQGPKALPLAPPTIETLSFVV